MLELLTDDINWLENLALGPCIAIKPLNNALTNHVFLLQYDHNQFYIFKRLNLAARSPKDRNHELLVQQLANEHGLSPKVLVSCDKYRLQEYIDGEHFYRDAISTCTIEMLASQLTLIHQLPPLYGQPQDLSGQLQRLKKCLNHAVDETLFDHYHQLSKQLDKSSGCDTLCHGDLSLNNILVEQNGEVKILDWEYAVLACAAYDLASCASINQLTAAQEEKLISAYFSLNNKKLSISCAKFKADCQSYRLLFTYLNQLWSHCFLEK